MDTEKRFKLFTSEGNEILTCDLKAIHTLMGTWANTRALSSLALGMKLYDMEPGYKVVFWKRIA